MLMLSGLILCGLTGLAVSLSGYETGNFINIFEYIGESLGSVHYTPPPYMTYRHGPSFHGSPLPPSFHKPSSSHYYGSAPSYHYGPPSHHYGLPPPFRKPPHYHHHHHYPHKPEPVFGSSFEQSGSWESQENVYQHTPPDFGSSEGSPGCNVPPVSQVVTTTTISASHPGSGQQTSNVNTLINGVFPGLVHEGQATVTNTGSGTTISRPGGSLISTDLGQQTSFPNTFETSVNEQPNNDRQTSPGSQGSDADHLISGVSQHLQLPYEQNSQSPPNNNVDNLISNVFPSTGQQSQTTHISTSSQTNVNNLIAGVFPGIGQQGQNGQQNTITSSVSTSSNTLVSGVIQSLPQQHNNGGGFQKPFVSSFKPGGLQTNGNAIPVFQPDYPSQQTPGTPTGSEVVNTTSQNIPVFQPGIDTTSSTVTTTGGNGNVVNSTDDEAPAYDIDIRFGGDDSDSSRRRRNRFARGK